MRNGSCAGGSFALLDHGAPRLPMIAALGQRPLRIAALGQLVPVLVRDAGFRGLTRADPVLTVPAHLPVGASQSRTCSDPDRAPVPVEVGSGQTVSRR